MILRNVYLYSIIALAIAIFMITMILGSAEYLLGYFAFILGLFIVSQICIYEKKVMPVLLVAFFIRIGIALLFPLIMPSLDSDPDGYLLRATDWSRGGLFETFKHFETGAYLYSWIISVIFSITDESVLMIKGLNVLFGSLIIWNVYRTSSLLWSHKVALKASWICALYPVLIIHSTVATSRDSLIIYSLTLAVYNFVRFQKTSMVRFFLLSLIFISFSLALHTAVIAIVLTISVIIAIKWLKVLFQNQSTLFLKYSIALFIIFVFGVAVVTSGWGMEKFGGSIENASIEKLESLQEGASLGRAAYLDGFTANSLVDHLWQTPIRVMFFLFAPFPWMIHEPIDIIGFIDSLFYFWVVRNIYRSRRYIKQNPPAYTTLIILIIFMTFFAVSVSNYGTALRHKAKLLPIAVSLIIVPNVLQHKERKKEIGVEKIES